MEAKSPWRPELTKGYARGSLPDWALIAFWLTAILLFAATLAITVQYALARVLPVPAVHQIPTDTVRSSASPQPTPSTTESQPKQSSGIVIAGTAMRPSPTSASPRDTPTPTAESLPSEILLQDVPHGRQTRALNCEFQTASDLAWYYGQPVTWEEIYLSVGHDVGGDPHKGFVGRSFDDQPGQLYPLGYGVYAEPIAQALAQLGLQAEVSYHASPEWLKAHIAAGRPVMVWATSNMTVRAVATWTTAEGNSVKGVPGEHTYLAVGYDIEGIWLLDPWDAQQRYFSWQDFLNSWGLLDRMAIVITSQNSLPQ